MSTQGDLVLAWVDCNHRIEQQFLWLLMKLRIDKIGRGSCNFSDVEHIV